MHAAAHLLLYPCTPTIVNSGGCVTSSPITAPAGIYDTPTEPRGCWALDHSSFPTFPATGGDVSFNVDTTMDMADPGMSSYVDSYRALCRV